MENTCEGKGFAKEEESPKDGCAESVTPENARWEWFDNTIINEYQTCPKKAFLKYQKHWRTKNVIPTLDFGRAYHLGTEYLTKGQPEKIAEVVASYKEPVGEELRTQAKLEKALKTYQAERCPPKWDKTLEIEKVVEMDLGCGTRFVVKPDNVIEWRGGIYGYERKHTAKLSSNYFASYARSSQMDAQMLAIKSKFGECHGIYLEATVIRKGGPYAKTKEIEFLTDIVTRTPQELEKAKEYFSRWMCAIKKDKEFLENRKSCFSYGYPCEFLPYCTGRIDNPEEHYQKRIWNPWAEVEEKVEGEV